MRSIRRRPHQQLTGLRRASLIDSFSACLQAYLQGWINAQEADESSSNFTN